MALKYPAANGNWSTAANWNGGTLPAAGDTVYANGKTIVIDQDVDLTTAAPTVSAGSFIIGHRYVISDPGTTVWTSLGALNNLAGTTFTATGVGSGTGTAIARGTLLTGPAVTSPSILTGGGFTVQGFTIRADVSCGSTVCLSAVGPVESFVFGNILAGVGTSSQACMGVSSASTLDITGDVLYIGTVSNYAASSSTAPANSLLIIRGNIFGGNGPQGCIYTNGHLRVYGDICTTASSGTAVIYTAGVAASSSCTVIGDMRSVVSSGYVLTLAGDLPVVIVGNLVANSAGVINRSSGASTIALTGNITSDGGVGILNTASGGAITVVGDIYGGISSSHNGIVSTYPVNVTVSGNLYAGANGSAIRDSSPDLSAALSLTFNGSEIDHYNGVVALSARRRKLGSDIGGVHRVALDGVSTFVTRSSTNTVAPSDVRAGVTYGSDTLVGSCAVPVPSSVQLGVPVDATVGTAPNLSASEMATAITAAIAASAIATDTAAAVRADLTPELTRLAKCATVETTAAQLAAFETA